MDEVESHHEHVDATEQLHKDKQADIMDIAFIEDNDDNITGELT